MRQYPEFHQFDVTLEVTNVLLLTILNTVVKNPLAAPFLHPVNELYAPGYSKAIKTPMDLSTIQKKIKRKDIQFDVNDFVLAIKQIFENCFTYNFEGSSIYTQAQDLETYFFDQVFENMNELIEHAKLNPVGSSIKQATESIIVYHLHIDTLKKCRSALRKISGHKFGYWFRQPVNHFKTVFLLND